jgi:hypothetical protein
MKCGQQLYCNDRFVERVVGEVAHHLNFYLFIYLLELNVRQHILALGYVDVAGRQNYWCRWLRMAGEIQYQPSLFGHLPTIATTDI